MERRNFLKGMAGVSAGIVATVLGGKKVEAKNIPGEILELKSDPQASDFNNAQEWLDWKRSQPSEHGDMDPGILSRMDELKESESDASASMSIKEHDAYYGVISSDCCTTGSNLFG
ncbi:MAG: hypothetical protein GY841_04410 [FCB group bacterium]|nr:hypothetical protein [FCB group bacterium]